MYLNSLWYINLDKLITPNEQINRIAISFDSTRSVIRWFSITHKILQSKFSGIITNSNKTYNLYNKSLPKEKS